jgi:hypothetical protein
VEPPSSQPDRALHRWSGFAAIAIAVLYVIITGLFVVAGAVPGGVDGVAWLDYLSGRIGLWWGIAVLSVLTDLLYVPPAVALALALWWRQRNLVATGAALLVTFVVLDLAVTWSSYASLMTLSGEWAGASASDRASIEAAAMYPVSVLDSTLWAVYAIAVPGLGILAIAIAMLRAGFSPAGAWVGIATGVLAVASVAGSLVVSGLGVLAIPTSVLTLTWFAIVGVRLARSGEGVDAR